MKKKLEIQANIFQNSYDCPDGFLIDPSNCWSNGSVWMALGYLKFNMPQMDFPPSSQSLPPFRLLSGTLILSPSHPSQIPGGHLRFRLLPAPHPLPSYSLLNVPHTIHSLSTPLSLPSGAARFSPLDPQDQLLNGHLTSSLISLRHLPSIKQPPLSKKFFSLWVPAVGTLCRPSKRDTWLPCLYLCPSSSSVWNAPNPIAQTQLKASSDSQTDATPVSFTAPVFQPGTSHRIHTSHCLFYPREEALSKQGERWINLCASSTWPHGRNSMTE